MFYTIGGDFVNSKNTKNFKFNSKNKIIENFKYTKKNNLEANKIKSYGNTLIQGGFEVSNNKDTLLGGHLEVLKNLEINGDAIINGKKLIIKQNLIIDDHERRININTNDLNKDENHRVAIYHSPNDALGLNYNNNYTGGVHIPTKSPYSGLSIQKNDVQLVLGNIGDFLNYGYKTVDDNGPAGRIKIETNYSSIQAFKHMKGNDNAKDILDKEMNLIYENLSDDLKNRIEEEKSNGIESTYDIYVRDVAHKNKSWTLQLQPLGGEVLIGGPENAFKGKLQVAHSGKSIGDFEAITLINDAKNKHAHVKSYFGLIVSDIDRNTGLGKNTFAIRQYVGDPIYSPNNFSDPFIVNESGKIVINGSNGYHANSKLTVWTNNPFDGFSVSNYDVRIILGFDQNTKQLKNRSVKTELSTNDEASHETNSGVLQVWAVNKGNHEYADGVPHFDKTEDLTRGYLGTHDTKTSRVYNLLINPYGGSVGIGPHVGRSNAKLTVNGGVCLFRGDHTGNMQPTLVLECSPYDSSRTGVSPIPPPPCVPNNASVLVVVATL